MCILTHMERGICSHVKPKLIFFRQLHMQVFILKDNHVQENTVLLTLYKMHKCDLLTASCHKTKGFLNHRYSCVVKNMPI